MPDTKVMAAKSKANYPPLYFHCLVWCTLGLLNLSSKEIVLGDSKWWWCGDSKISQELVFPLFGMVYARTVKFKL